MDNEAIMKEIRELQEKAPWFDNIRAYKLKEKSQ